MPLLISCSPPPGLGDSIHWGASAIARREFECYNKTLTHLLARQIDSVNHVDLLASLLQITYTPGKSGDDF